MLLDSSYNDNNNTKKWSMTLHVAITVYVMCELIDLTITTVIKLVFATSLYFVENWAIKKLSHLSLTTGKGNEARMVLRHWGMEFTFTISPALWRKAGNKCPQ